MSLLDYVLELIYPTRCAFCHSFTENGQKVCSRCIDELPYNVDHAVHVNIRYAACCAAPFYYMKHVKHSLRRYKFHGLSAYSEIYGEFMAKSIDEMGITCDIISWVPLSKKRYRHRGYDQAELLAEDLSGRFGIESRKLIEKTVDNPAQSGTGGPARRRANVKGVYKACAPDSIKGKRILLIDDIVTTGATLSECARILHENGAAEIFAATVACSSKLR